MLTDVSVQPSFPSSIGCLKMSVRNYHYQLRNNPEECGSLHVSRFQIRVGIAESVVPGTKQSSVSLSVCLLGRPQLKCDGTR